MKKIEYLILQGPLDYTNENLINIVNDYNIDISEIIKVAARLFQKGYILADRYLGTQDNGQENWINDLVLRKSEIEDLFDGDTFDFSYKLTPEGGARWESMTKPNWQWYKYIALYTDYDDVEKIEIVSTQKAIIKQALTFDSLSDSFQYIPGTEIWDVLEPWQAKYWKTLPKGYRVIAQRWSSGYALVNEVPSIQWIDSDFLESQKAYEELCRSQPYHWYTEPDLD